MTERFERILIVILASVTILLSLWFRYSYEKIQDDRMTILEYQEQIDQLKIDSEEQRQRFEKLRDQANKEMRQIETATKKILMTKVPKDCNKAMDWGIRAARAFR